MLPGPDSVPCHFLIAHLIALADRPCVTQNLGEGCRYPCGTSHHHGTHLITDRRLHLQHSNTSFSLDTDEWVSPSGSMVATPAPSCSPFPSLRPLLSPGFAYKEAHNTLFHLKGGGSLMGISPTTNCHIPSAPRHQRVVTRSIADRLPTSPPTESFTRHHLTLGHDESRYTIPQSEQASAEISKAARGFGAKAQDPSTSVTTAPYRGEPPHAAHRPGSARRHGPQA